MSAEGIRIEGLTKRFGDVTAVDALDLEIGAGEFVSILGPSGCGKTTLLRMLAGLEQPSGGTIAIAGRTVNELPPAKRDIAMVFQTYALYPHMTVAKNIEYPLRKRRVAAAERKRLVAEAAELLELTELLGRKPRELSGGQQQRVALGRALVRDPAVFLLDEPLSNLDAKLRSHMRVELIRLQKRIGRTMVYVTHDQLEAMTMSQRIAVLNDGRLQQYAPPEVIYRRPANAFVAGFIGTPAMNFVEGRLEAAGGELEFVNGALRLPAGRALAGNRDDLAGRAVRAGFRPEDLAVGEGGLCARVTVVEPTGHEVIAMLDWQGHEVVARFSPDDGIREADSITVTPRSDRLHFFDAADGSRLNADGPSEGEAT